MTTRTFKQYGIAYGTTPVNITAKIDNVVVYEGPVETLNEPFPALPNLSYTVTNTLFSWTADVNFTGTQTVEIATTGDVVLATLKGNYTPIADATGNIISSGPDDYVTFKYTQFGNTYINNSLQTVEHGDLGGMWWWSLQTADTFVEEITIEPGLE